MQADLEAGKGDSERSSLLGTARAGLGAAGSLVKDVHIDVPLIEDTCVIKYDPVELTSLTTLWKVRGSIFTQGSMWYVLGLTFSLCFGLAFLIVRLIEKYDQYNPDSFSTETISSVIRSVTVAMAFLLGLFVNNAMSRWWDIIKEFEKLFGATKRIVQLLVSLGAKSSVRVEVGRRAVLSIEMLRFETVVKRMDGDAAVHWTKKFDEMQADDFISAEERSCLESVDENMRSFFSWQLVSKSIKVLRPDMPDMYKGVYKVVQEGGGAVSSLKTISNFQFPFLYVHMLAWMVHLVNILTSVASGITIGIVIARARASPKNDAGFREPIDASAIFKELLFLFIQVFLYQAFLGIGAALSYPIVPIGHGAMYRLPLSEMITSARKTLADMNRLGDEKVI